MFVYKFTGEGRRQATAKIFGVVVKNQLIMNLQSQEKIIEKIAQLRAKLRPGQVELTYWQGGKMAVSAVPGSGKSYSLAVAGAIAVYEQNLNQNRYLLIVTYTRSAAASIKEKIKTILTDELHLPPVGFVVQTIHSLASSIVNRYPFLSGLNLDANSLVEVSSSHPLILETVENWMSLNSPAFETLLYAGKNFNREESEVLRRESVLRTEVLPKFTHTVINTMKSSGWDLDNLQSLNVFHNNSLYPMMDIASELYQEYEKLTHKYQIIDYDDLILGALNVLKNDSARRVLQGEVIGVFEDEAQDSTPLQGDLLSILAQDNDHSEPNLVRVGDPNQAINSTYTASDPFYFHNFCQECRLKNTFFLMEQAGRSSEIIINYANKILAEFVAKMGGNLIDKQEIKVVGENDSQPDSNPLAEGEGVEINPEKKSPISMDLMINRIIDLLDPSQGEINSNCAILVRSNWQSSSIFKALEKKLAPYNIPVKLIGDRLSMGDIVKEILGVLQFIANPHSSKYVNNMLRILATQELIKKVDFDRLSIYPERFLYPTKLDDSLKPEEEKAREYCLKLLKASIELSSYQLIPFICSLLNYQQKNLTTAQQLCDRIEKENRGKMSLKTMIENLIEINSIENYSFIETENDDIYTKKGQVTILTMHKSKGLEWDYVFLPFYDVDDIERERNASSSSNFLGEFKLDDVIRTQLRQGIHQQRLKQTIQPLSITEAWEKAREEKRGEEYRLLYVAITRAKKLLYLTSIKL